ncbi:hypothetical protein DEO72_LG8g1315 [Vigna unguiculata]|uniref:Uncharacterized protein n=1 Tax=Vigna unguiculata TaxID=3917 RepID=A0A4D6MRN4_VIGUN|nr:hypothetical protein DEO72_LG8g1315 [Vigna unguiculata]
MRFAITAAIIARFTIAITPTIAVKYRLAIAGEECFAMLSFAIKGKTTLFRNAEAKEGEIVDLAIALRCSEESEGF